MEDNGGAVRSKVAEAQRRILTFFVQESLLLVEMNGLSVAKFMTEDEKSRGSPVRDRLL